LVRPGWEVMAAFAALAPIGPVLVDHLQLRRATRKKQGSVYMVDVAAWCLDRPSGQVSQWKAR
jgi:hypothetical protein